MYGMNKELCPDMYHDLQLEDPGFCETCGKTTYREPYKCSIREAPAGYNDGTGGSARGLKRGNMPCAIPQA